MYQLHVILKDKEYAHLKEQLRRSGLSISTYIRKRVLGEEVKERITAEVIQLCHELTGIREELAQLTRAARAGTPVAEEQVAAIEQRLTQLWFWARFESDPPV